jgi:hypothetical protein
MKRMPRKNQNIGVIRPIRAFRVKSYKLEYCHHLQSKHYRADNVSENFEKLIMKFPSKNTTILFVFSFFWISIGLSIVYLGWTPTWTALYIPTMSPIFADMRTVQGSLYSIEHGYNPQVENPGDPWRRVMNYPLIWVEISKFFHLDNEKNFVLLVSCYIFAYLVCCFLLLRDFPSIYIILAMFSGSSLLAVERGNNDLIIFVLLFAGIYTAQHYFRDYIKVFTFLLATILKVYPVVAIISFIKKPKPLSFLMFAITSYFIYINSELKVIQHGNTANGKISYGLINFLRWISIRIISDETKIAFVSLMILLSLLLIIAITRNLQLKESKELAYSADLLITGGSIFVFTYLIAPNWDYRLIFLLFCIPYILFIENDFIKHSTLFCILISMNIVVVRDISPDYVSVISKHYAFLVIAACLLKELKIESTAKR